ncbi:MAG: lovK [Phenylobacterium sp.]|nr:lovK [Phenylobacterium sp.]MDB5495485.1 lovK [Phenylobacterium sp.]
MAMAGSASDSTEGGPPGRAGGLEAELAQTTARLREVDHRIKNDLQLIASVFVLQMRKLPEGPEREIIRGALERIGAVSAVHRRLDVTADPKQFETSGLVRDVVEEALGAARRDDVRVEFDLSPVTVPTRQAAPLALVVGELVRNSLKHGFAGRPGVLRVSLSAADGTASLSVRDNGAGLPAGVRPGGFGATLVALLAQQLRGEFEIAETHPGVAAVLRFPESP